jgi:hypothetical protein
VVRSRVIALFLTPIVLTFTWGDSLTLYFGAVDASVQAAYFPPPDAELGEHEVRILDTRRVVPSPGMPAAVRLNHANNNLDVARHDGRVYLAWRTAPDHFASTEASIQVMSSVDEVTWRFERRISVGHDLREPRLLSLHGSLFLYMTELGSNFWAFEPKGVLVTERRPDGEWTQPESVGLPGYVAWRTRMEQGRPYMVAYRGGENIYRFNGEPLQVALLTTDDGRHFHSIDSRRAYVSEGGGSEADFTLTEDGSLHAVIRNEAGDDTGFGSKICHAEAGHLAEWRCHADPRKFDSPHVFRHGGEVYLLARRNVTSDGVYDRGGPLRTFNAIRNELSYITSAKRCALWRVVPSGRVAFVRDLPSRGDTCFPALVETEDPDQLAVYDYSSAIDGADVPWSVGQRQRTFIYRHVLQFTPRIRSASR